MGSIYIKPLNEVYQAFCIAAIFLLFLEYLGPDADETTGEKYFGQLENYDKKHKLIPGGSWAFYKRTWLLVFQFPVTKALSATAQDITQATNVYCVKLPFPKVRPPLAHTHRHVHHRRRNLSSRPLPAPP